MFLGFYALMDFRATHDVPRNKHEILKRLLAYKESI